MTAAAVSILATPPGVTAASQAAWLLTAPARLLLALVSLVMALTDGWRYTPRHAASGRHTPRPRTTPGHGNHAATPAHQDMGRWVAWPR